MLEGKAQSSMLNCGDKLKSEKYSKAIGLPQDLGEYTPL